MAAIENSALLNKILEYAKTFDQKGTATLTAERYLLSVIEVVSDNAPIAIGAEEKSKLMSVLLDKLPSDDVGFVKTKKTLREHIAGKSTSYLDGLYIQQRSYKAKELAKSRGLEALSPELLLECILNEPDDFIKKCITDNGGADSSDQKLFPDILRREESAAEPQADEAEAEGSGAAEEQEQEIPAQPRKDPALVADLTKRVRELRDRLSEVVVGQENAINVFTSGYYSAERIAATDMKRTRPAGTFLFAGPPGVGKTFLVKTIVDKLEMQQHAKVFDMSEYAANGSFMDLVGYDDNYKNPKEGVLTGFVRRHPKCILLFDEIEKAHLTTIQLFLQILDQGVLTDNRTQKQVSFKDALIFFTTNAGKELYNAPDAYDFSATPRRVILKALQKEINPITMEPVFPAAICSRFASGNVVMFNHLSASSLCEIAEKAIREQADNFENGYGIKVSFDRDVFAALMFAEGGSADARSLRGRSEKFFDDEILELLRFASSEEHSGDITSLESINFKVELPSDPEIRTLFRNNEKHSVLVYASDETIRMFEQSCPDVRILGASDTETTKEKLSSNNVGFAVIDLQFELQGEKRFLNIEDIESSARDVFWYIREKFSGIPVYILQRRDTALSHEELKSFLKNGARGAITVDDGSDLSTEVTDVCEKMYQQSCMTRLAASNHLVTCETGQRILPDGKTAEITLFDFELSTAVDAEDTQNVMSNVSKPNVKFDSIIGAENAKDELKFFIEYLKDPKKFVESGLRAPRGVLLYGPPGTGKTMLAKAVASEAGVTFISAEGNQFLKKYVGEGKDDLHEIFTVARKYAPSILFIDEFEAIAKERRGGDHAAANGEDVLTALLTEMDGFNTDITRPVFVLAATNFDVTPGSGRSLDPALLRRFDSRICVDLPNKEERIRFINMKCAGSKAFAISAPEIDSIALRSTGMSLADLDSILELSLRVAIRKDDKKVTDQVLDEAFETFLGGEEKTWDASQLERTARHEAGHTFLCWHSGETPSYVTIVARGDHGGYMRHDDQEGKMLYTKEELLAMIRTALGGRAAEIVYYGEKDGVSTGASSDLASATNLARQIICTYGMDEAFGLAVIDQQAAREGELSLKVRDAVNRILDREMKKAVSLIAANRPLIDALVEKLLSENHLYGEEIVRVFSGSGTAEA